MYLSLPGSTRRDKTTSSQLLFSFSFGLINLEAEFTDRGGRVWPCRMPKDIFFVLCVVSLSCIWLFETPWAAACQAPLFMVILQARKLACIAMPSSRGSSQPGIEPRPPTLQADSLPLHHQGSPPTYGRYWIKNKILFLFLQNVSCVCCFPSSLILNLCLLSRDRIL